MKYEEAREGGGFWGKEKTVQILGQESPGALEVELTGRESICLVSARLWGDGQRTVAWLKGRQLLGDCGTRWAGGSRSLDRMHTAGVARIEQRSKRKAGLPPSTPNVTSLPEALRI